MPDPDPIPAARASLASRWRAVMPLAGLGAFAVALWVLHRVLATYNAHELLHDLRGIPLSRLAAATVLTLIDYWALTAYDALSLRAIGGRLPYPQVAAASFMAFSCSHNLGYAVISGGAIRWRYYSAWGLKAAEIAAITILGGMAFWFGFLVIGALASMAWPPTGTHAWLSQAATRWAGLGVLVATCLTTALLLLRRRPWVVREWTVPAPHLGSAMLLLVVGCLDWLLVPCVVWVLLPGLDHTGFIRFLGCFILASAAGNISQVPGGLGVLEASLLVLLAGQITVPALAGALVAYRAIYFLLPFLSALGLMGAIEWVRHSAARALPRVLVSEARSGP
jgi:phosphatidylglycerol lysyltransferase